MSRAAHSAAHDQQKHLPWRVALAARLAATSTTATSAGAEVRCVVLALAIVPLGVIVAGIARRASFKVWALLHVGEHILAAIIRGDEAETFVLEKLF